MACMNSGKTEQSEQVVETWRVDRHLEGLKETSSFEWKMGELSKP